MRVCCLYLYENKTAVMYKEIGSFLAEELEQIKKDGLFKSERVISGPQGSAYTLVRWTHNWQPQAYTRAPQVRMRT